MTKYTRNSVSEYNKMLIKHNLYRDKLTQLLGNKKFKYTSADGVDCSNIKKINSDIVYLIRKIHNTDPLRPLSTLTLPQGKSTQASTLTPKPIIRSLKQSKVVVQPPLETVVDNYSEISSEDRYSIIEGSDTDSDTD